MGLQVIVVADDMDQIGAKLGAIAEESEIFPIADGRFGLSIPAKVVNRFGEQAVLGTLAAFERFDLWAGAWKRPGPGR